MADKFQKFYSTLESPATKAFEVIPSDTPLALATRSIYIGGQGDLVVTLIEDEEPVMFENIPAGTVMPLRASVIHANTTCTAVVGIV